MTDDELKRLLETMRQENSATHVDTRRHFDVSVERVEKKFDVSVERVEKKFDASVAELRHYFDVVTEATKHEVRLVAESVAHLNDELQRETNALRQEMSRGFAETQAMIKSLTPNWTAA